MRMISDLYICCTGEEDAKAEQLSTNSNLKLGPSVAPDSAAVLSVLRGLSMMPTTTTTSSIIYTGPNFLL